MAKFNVTDRRRYAVTGPIATALAGGVTTYEGGRAFALGIKSELFTLAVANMVGEDTFYEKADVRDERYAELVRKVAVADGEWMAGFIGWLRGTANMRSASVVAAAEAVHARLGAGVQGGNRELVSAALRRADEPGELLSYWRGRFGRALPKPVKRGLGDAVVRLVDEYTALKYDTPGRAYRLGDVIDVVRPRPVDARQSALFEYLLARRHGRDELLRGDAMRQLPMVAARIAFGEIDPSTRRTLLGTEHLQELLAAAGLTWEALSAWIDGPMDAAAWESVIPQMGLMALARNLRNFDEAGVSDAVARQVSERFADPAQVSKSRMFPFRWLAAFEHAPSLRWGPALGAALNASLSNIPELPGRTLVLVDTSGSMTSRAFSAKSTMTPAKAAAVFGTAIAHRNAGRVDLVGFATGSFTHPLRKGGDLIAEVDRFLRRTGEVGHGTEIGAAVRRYYAGHDRVFIISDMQSADDGSMWAVPTDKPLYGVDLGGYGSTVIPAGQQARRYQLAGLTDAMFSMVPLLEAGTSQGWPWE
jgi:hypothetical protein